jgi:hypothetical protein
MTSHMEGLASELTLLILVEVDCEQSLYNLIRASRRCYHVFLTNKGKVLQSVLARKLSAEVIPYAVAVIAAAEASRHEITGHRIIKLIELWRQFDYSTHVLPLNFLVPILGLHRCVDHFVQEFADHVVPKLQQYAAASGNPPNLSFDARASSVSPVSLSAVERTRLQRAFYHFQIYGRLFGSNPALTGAHIRSFSNQVVSYSATLQYRLYLLKFPLWQVEELACIRQYLVSRIVPIFFSLEDEFVKTVLSSTHDTLQRQVDFDHEDFFFSRKNKEGGQTHGIEKLLSKGIPFLRRLFESEGQERLNMVIYNVRPSHDFLGKSLRLAASRARMVGDAQVSKTNGSVPIFSQDSPDQPNEAWIWSEDYRLSSTFSSRGCDIRDWGYVFWDHNRLAFSGMLGKQ